MDDPSSQHSTNDTHSVADINGDGKIDQFVYNDQDWSTQSLGRMISEDTTLAADWVADWVGKWNLGRGSACALRGARVPVAGLICWWIIMTGLA